MVDKIKDDIRQHLPKSIFLPVDKRDFMHLLSAQDDIADAVEDLAVLVRIKKVNVPDNICFKFKLIIKKIYYANSRSI